MPVTFHAVANDIVNSALSATANHGYQLQTVNRFQLQVKDSYNACYTNEF